MNADRYSMLTRLRLIGAMGLVVLLLGCGGGSDDPMATYRDQTVAWGACDTNRFDKESLAIDQELSSRVVCADIRAPIDYANPAQGEIKVAVMRVKGANGRNDNPAILFNPGGPGDDGWSFGLRAAALWGRSDTTEDPAVAHAYQELAATYDLVGFSPRGTGWSTTLTCPRSQAPFPVADPTRNLDPTNIENTLRNSQLIAQSCENNPLMPFINTDATARDMDLIRHLLHQDKLNYIGLSYGTWLGNWYASIFPERVGRMLLTGVTNFSVPLSHQNLIEDEVRQDVFDKVIIPYAANNSSSFGFDPAITIDSLRFLISHLSDDLHSALVNEFINTSLLSSASKIKDAVLTLRAVQVLDVAQKKKPTANESDLKEALVDTSNQTVHSIGQKLLDRHFRPETPDDAMYWSIVCNDIGTDYTPDTWVTESNENARKYPDFGGAVRENACLYWRKPTIPRPQQWRAAQTGPIVMIQSEKDPLTILPGAMNSLSLLPNASMVIIDDEITHAPVPPYGTTCVDKPIADYFLRGTPLPRMTHCPAR